MKKNYGFDTDLNKLELSAESLWMEVQLGEGELEVVNHGRSRISDLSFSQETGAIGQQTPRIGDIRPKLGREFSAGRTRHSDSTPRFFSQSPEATQHQAPPEATLGGSQQDMQSSIHALQDLIKKYKKEIQDKEPV